VTYENYIGAIASRHRPPATSTIDPSFIYRLSNDYHVA
jgi:hypothetical protein